LAMSKGWNKALEKYNWTVDLRCFSGAANYPGYFNRVIRPADVVAFENAFRIAVNEAGSFEIAGEVCFWKNYGAFRNKVTQRLLTYLAERANWDRFVRAVKQVSANPSYDNLVALQSACSQPSGFATPITFLAFYKPTEYPMVDKHIANWWSVHKAGYGFGDSPKFSQRNDDWIRSSEQSWNAYIAWRRFCCYYAVRMAKNWGLNWRARDVEMAVWEAQKSGVSLSALP
jgi:hypothetical protein